LGMDLWQLDLDTWAINILWAFAQNRWLEKVVRLGVGVQTKE